MNNAEKYALSNKGVASILFALMAIVIITFCGCGKTVTTPVKKTTPPATFTVPKGSYVITTLLGTTGVENVTISGTDTTFTSRKTYPCEATFSVTLNDNNQYELQDDCALTPGVPITGTYSVSNTHILTLNKPDGTIFHGYVALTNTPHVITFVLSEENVRYALVNASATN